MRVRWLTILLLICAVARVPAAALAAPPAGYYDSVDSGSAAALRVTLHDVIDDHTRIPYTAGSTDTWNVLELAQQDPANATRILDVYRNASYPKAGAGNSNYDREHVWPKSYGFPNDSGANYPYSDCHMLRLADGSYNGARGNRPFATCDAGCTRSPTVFNDGQGGGSGPYPDDDNWGEGSGASGRWETWPGRRGDVARAMFYADIRYEGGFHGLTGANEPDLELTDDTALIAASNTGGNTTGTAYMGLLSTLLQWHLDDPVDDFERDRNDVVYSFQGNRNPLVDHPEWVAILYGTGGGCVADPECDDGVFCNGAETCAAGTCIAGSDPCPAPLLCDEVQAVCSQGGTGGEAAVWINELHYDNAGTDAGEFIEVAGTAGLDLSGYLLVGYSSGGGGNSYQTVVLSGLLPDQGGCAGTLAFTFTGLQNGAADGVALVDPAGDVVEFISYEGAFTAAGGPAAGLTSTDIGVSESSSTPVGHSLQLAGSGAVGAEFAWQAAQAATRGFPNTGQTFDACVTPPATVPVLPHGRGLLWLFSALLVLGAACRRRGA